jgi:hypothetical protein
VWRLTAFEGAASSDGRLDSYCGVPYSRSFPLGRWLGPRREAIDALAQAHAQLGEVDGPGRPLEIGRPVAHAYVLRVVAEFQAFARDLHDLAAETMVRMSGAGAGSQAMLIAAATVGRMIDRGNADLRSLEQDFRRVGISGISSRIASHSVRWSSDQSRRGDQAYYQDLIELRNALAHGNQQQLDRLRYRGVLDTMSWARGRLPGLGRTARALDHVVWDHLHSVFGRNPW